MQKRKNNIHRLYKCWKSCSNVWQDDDHRRHYALHLRSCNTTWQTKCGQFYGSYKPRVVSLTIGDYAVWEELVIYFRSNANFSRSSDHSGLPPGGSCETEVHGSLGIVVVICVRVQILWTISSYNQTNTDQQLKTISDLYNTDMVIAPHSVCCCESYWTNVQHQWSLVLHMWTLSYVQAL